MIHSAPRSLAALAGPAALAGLALAVAACGDDHPPQPDAPPARSGPRAVIAAGTFMAGEAGVLSALWLEPMEVDPLVAPAGAVGDDPMIRRAGGELFVVNRSDGNNVTILDAATFAVKEQLATGAGSNPQDVAVHGDQLFLPAFDAEGVVVVTRGTGARSTIDLSALDPDGHPNCVSAYTVGDEIYVVCELLDGSYKPRGPGRVAVIDAASRAVKTTFPLAGANPVGALEQLPAGVLGGDLVIPTAENIIGDPTIGCVERIQTGAAPRSNGCLVTNQALGGYAARLDVQLRFGTPILWLVVNRYDGGARGGLRGYDLDAQMLWSAAISPPAQVLVDLAVCPNGAIVVADQTMAASGLRLYDGIMELTAAPMPIGLRPGSAHGLACYE